MGELWLDVAMATPIALAIDERYEVARIVLTKLSGVALTGGEAADELMGSRRDDRIDGGDEGSDADDGSSGVDNFSDANFMIYCADFGPLITEWNFCDDMPINAQPLDRRLNLLEEPPPVHVIPRRRRQLPPVTDYRQPAPRGGFSRRRPGRTRPRRWWQLLGSQQDC